jgi:hypothetical protein
MRLPDLTRYRAFDSIELRRYQRFWEHWKLVTVRYRADNGEQRFVFANPIAWRAMRLRSSVYPDGAMFGKVAFAAGEDPSFPNSREPRQFTRIQLMRKDSRAYPETDGWGYALLTAAPGGAPYGEERSTVTACHACHRLVPERNFVFSTPSFLGDGHAPSVTQSVAFKARFADQNVASLSAFQRDALNRVGYRHGDSEESSRQIRALTLDLFPGSVNESVGPLSWFASEENLIYALWDEPHGQFAVALPLPPTSACHARARFGFTVGVRPANVAGAIAGPPQPPRVRIGETCDGVWKR